MLPQFGISEFLLLAIIALIVVGPKDLPRMMHSLGQFASKARRMAGEFRASFDEIAKQAQMEELREEIETIKRENVVTKAVEELKETEVAINEAIMRDPGKEQAKTSESKDKSIEQAKQETARLNPKKDNGIADTVAEKQTNLPKTPKSQSVSTPTESSEDQQKPTAIDKKKDKGLQKTPAKKRTNSSISASSQSTSKRYATRKPKISKSRNSPASSGAKKDVPPRLKAKNGESAEKPKTDRKRVRKLSTTTSTAQGSGQGRKLARKRAVKKTS